MQSTIQGLEVVSHVVLGNVRHELDVIAKQTGVDLIVVGSHGRHGFARLLGSTATALVHHVSCDLLLVRINEV